jgi:hypothetical protein
MKSTKPPPHTHTHKQGSQGSGKVPHGPASATGAGASCGPLSSVRCQTHATHSLHFRVPSCDQPSPPHKTRAWMALTFLSWQANIFTLPVPPSPHALSFPIRSTAPCGAASSQPKPAMQETAQPIPPTGCPVISAQAGYSTQSPPAAVHGPVPNRCSIVAGHPACPRPAVRGSQPPGCRPATLHTRMHGIAWPRTHGKSTTLTLQ